jgi:hypothetical protein
MARLKTKGRILKAAKGKLKFTYKNKYIIISNLSLETPNIHKACNNVYLNETTDKKILLYSEKLSFKFC